MTEAAHVADFVERDAFEIVPARFAVGRHGPRECRVEEDVRFDQLARRTVDQNARRREDPIELRPALKADRR